MSIKNNYIKISLKTFLFLCLISLWSCATKSSGSSESTENEIIITEREDSINGLKVVWNPEITSEQEACIRDLLADMVEIKGGEFMMGSNHKDAFDDERPVHAEKIKTFRLEAHEVDQRLWTSIMEENPSFFRGDSLPVENITIEACLIFIDRLNELTSLNFRLPTEAEWEYAAQGGENKDPFLYSGSDNAEDVSWFRDTSGEQTNKVGTKQPNSLGLYDMSGNVWEFTSERIAGDYDSPRESKDYVVRGGSWNLDAWNSRVSRRGRFFEKESDGTVGMRLAL